MRPKADTDDDAITASQRLQANLQKMIDEVEAEEEQDKEMTDTQVALRRYGLSRAIRSSNLVDNRCQFTGD